MRNRALARLHRRMQTVHVDSWANRRRRYLLAESQAIAGAAPSEYPVDVEAAHVVELPLRPPTAEPVESAPAPSRHRVTCAWCGRVMVDGPDLPSGSTHGICARCIERYFGL